MRHPIKFNTVLLKIFEDPFSVNKCLFEENPHQITETLGGFEQHPLALELSGVPVDELSASVIKLKTIINR